MTMDAISRRSCLKALAALVGALAIPSIQAKDNATAVVIQAEPKELDQIASLVQQFLTQFRVPSLSIAIARQGEFVYRNAFGLIDKENHRDASTESLYRIASISKPITSVAVFSLIEQGKINLHDHVFGPDGVLGNDYGTNLPDWVRIITVYHLLTHTAGGWSNNKNDPMFQRSGHLNQHEFIAWILASPSQKLENEPGTNYAYSNFGYCILGRIIEKVSGLTYSDYVKQNVLAKCGISDMRIAGDKLADRSPSEAVYYDDSGHSPYNMDFRRMDSHGGWLASPTDLVEFAMRVTGLKAGEQILKEETVKTMMTPSTVNAGYACGWCVNNRPNWWHDGSLPGTSSILVRTASGLCWSAISNARNEGISPALDQLIWKIVRYVPAWQS